MADFRLKVFLSVAHHLSFTAASKELYISQPAISKHIQELESDFKVRLFERKRNRISLTNAGKLLVEHAEELMLKYQNLEYAMHQLHGDLVGELRLGASSTIAQYILPPLLAQFAKLHPKVKLSLMSGNTKEIEEAIENHDIDLGFIEGTSRRNHLKYSAFIDDELIVISSTQSIIPPIITASELTTLPVILREQGSGTLDVIQVELNKHNIHIKDLYVPLYLGSTESIKLYVANSEALGIVSIRAVQDDIQHGLLRVIQIQGVEFKRELCFISLQGELSPLPSIFMDFVYQYKKKL